MSNVVIIWDFIDPNGKQGFSKDRDKLSDELAEKASDYMNDGKVIAYSSSNVFEDFFQPGVSSIKPKAEMTDGLWRWSSYDAHYVEHYKLSPCNEFLDYLKSRDFAQRVPTDAEIKRIYETLLER